MIAENSHIARARLLLSQGRIKDAEKEIGYALQEDPDNAEALMLLAECKLDNKQYRESITISKKCLTLDPSNDRCFYLIAFCYYRMNDLDNAVDYIQKAIVLNPYFSGYFGLYAYILLDKKTYSEALAKANEGLAVNPEDLTCLNARSQALFRLKNKEEAYETIKEALSINPEDDFTHTNVAWHYLEKGKHKTAREHFREALRINPSNNRARQGYKESLRAKLLPYKWMLMFSLWLSSKSKSVRWVTIIMIWLIVRLVSGASEAAGFTVVAYVLAILYLLFVMFSWIGNSLANLMLLFTSEGKYVLTQEEKDTASIVGFFLLLGLATIAAGHWLTWLKNDDYFMPAMIFISLTLPLSRINFPLHLKHKTFAAWYTYGLAAFGIIIGFATAVAGSVLLPFVIAYGVAFIIYTWFFSFTAA